jgi:LmbE family N-acetylglucosaminyl deacetylase
MLQFRANGRPIRLLCLGAHCDDIEIGCGGTLLRLAEEQEVAARWVVFSGDPARQAESRKAAGLFLSGAVEREVETLAFKESFLPWQAEEVKLHFETLKSWAPDVIFTHFGGDAHQDHRLISELTWNTFRSHLILEYEIPKYEGDLGNPSVFLPLPRRIAERKVEALLELFPSQKSRAWFSADTFQALMRLRGVQCNAREGLAEAFHCKKAVIV